jgi:Na+/phosphate symporter
MLGRNIEAIEEGLLSMITGIEQMIRLLPHCIKHCKASEMDECEGLALVVSRQAKVLTRALVAPASGGEVVQELIRFPLRLERMADELASVLTCCRMKALGSLAFDEAAHETLNAIFAILLEMVGKFRETMAALNNSEAEEVRAQGALAAHLLDQARVGHWIRLEKGQCTPEAGSLFLDILDSLKSVNEYLQKMTANLLRWSAVGNGREGRRTQSDGT